MRPLLNTQLAVVFTLAFAGPVAAQQLWLEPEPQSQQTGYQPTLIADDGNQDVNRPPRSNGAPPAQSSPVRHANYETTVQKGLVLSQEPSEVASERKSSAIPLPPPSESQSETPSTNNKSRLGGGNALFTVASSLAIVLGLFFGVVWLSRRTLPRVGTGLSSDVVELLGRTTLANRQALQLIRVGKKLLLVCVTPSGATTLTEIIDPVEVDRLVGLCTGDHSDGATTSFRDVLMQLGSPADARQQAQSA